MDFNCNGLAKLLSQLLYIFFVNDLPVAFKNHFRKSSDIHEHPTRHVNDLDVTNNKKSFSDHSIQACGTILRTPCLQKHRILNLNLYKSLMKSI